MSILDIKTNVEALVTNNDYSVTDLKKILDPVTKYIDNPVFIQNINGIIDILITDRNHNNKFDVEDLNLLGNDPIACISLVSSILLVLNSIPSLQIKYDSGTTEELVFKILAYIFLEFIPIRTGTPLSKEEKIAILNLALIIYQTIVSSQITQKLVADVMAKLKTTKSWNCLCGTTQPDPLQNALPAAKIELATAINNVRDKAEIQKSIRSLESKLISKK